ncbi:unnamed protein product [Prorocentrum cordatum]|uniref:Uncharacterized protein n=1 Tax=Prorocentrum cordatum TaxID=2364126 RepID=A0ABN9UTR4_9DINO|nr:unnamed protein product [Polarella glacialis]
MGCQLLLQRLRRKTRGAGDGLLAALQSGLRGRGAQGSGDPGDAGGAAGGGGRIREVLLSSVAGVTVAVSAALWLNQASLVDSAAARRTRRIVRQASMAVSEAVLTPMSRLLQGYLQRQGSLGGQSPLRSGRCLPASWEGAPEEALQGRRGKFATAAHLAMVGTLPSPCSANTAAQG